jgi:hypothetical protein
MASLARTVVIVDEFKVRINSVYSGAKISKPDNRTLSDEIVRVFSDPRYGKLPVWAKEVLSSYAHSMREVLKKDYTILLSTGLDGRKMVGKWDDLTEAERDHIRAGGKLPSAFYWLECKESCDDSGVITRIMTPTDKVYFQPVS